MIVRASTVTALLACLIACGGINTSDDRRVPARAAAPDDDADERYDDDAGAGEGANDGDEGSGSTTDPSATDAGSPAADAAPPVPAGSFAAGSELETTADLNLREGPGTDFAVIVTMPEATRVKVQTTSGADGWVHLDYKGTLGYASKAYLKTP